jgi:H+-transporting ATPase
VIASVSAIGTKSSYGKTAELVRTAEAPGRLQILLFNIIRYLAYLDVLLAVILVVTAFVKGTPWQELLPFLVILFIATIPISMPSSFTVANSLEAQNLAKEGVLVTGLTGIQEAAGLNVLLVDKTGTLTNNRPEIAEVVTFEQMETAELLQLAASASDETSNDSISIAILQAFKEQNLAMPVRTSFTVFDPVQKVSKAQISQNGGQLNVVLGSPAVIAKIAAVPDKFMDQVNSLSIKGSRGFGSCFRSVNEKLALPGIIALADSPRDDAKEQLLKYKN